MKIRKRALSVLILSVCLLIPLAVAMNSSAVYLVPSGINRVSDLAERISSMTRAKVVRVVDGDTIVVQLLEAVEGFSEKEKVRFIGVDTPETVDPRRPVAYFGAEASRHTKDLLEGRTVRLAFGHELRDRFGRLLAYVFVDDGTCVNLQIVRDGFGFAYTKYPFPFSAEFSAAERTAKQRKAGLWGRVD